jgi:hypothetical protein
MSSGDKIQIQGTVFNVLKRDGNRLLLAWTEKTGENKTRWILINKQLNKENLK